LQALDASYRGMRMRRTPGFKAAWMPSTSKIPAKLPKLQEALNLPGANPQD
jgi:hypothetical protein